MIKFRTPAASAASTPERTTLGTYSRHSTCGPALAAQVTRDAQDQGYPDVRLDYDERDEAYVVTSSASAPSKRGAK